jgi:hypothetical protein
LASNFNNDPSSSGASAPEVDATHADPPAADGTQPESTAAPPVVGDPPASAGFARFRSCRWQQPADAGLGEFCTHREVKPYAGTTGFDADAWCLACQYYKLRRTPKKRERDEDGY